MLGIHKHGIQYIALLYSIQFHMLKYYFKELCCKLIKV